MREDGEKGDKELQTWQARLPVSMGGLGLQAAADHA